MNLDHLKEFIHLAHTLNYTATASALHLTQPTLSKHIIELEREMGAKLFVRSSSHVELTEEGAYFLEVATRTVDGLEEAKENIEAMQLRKPIRIDGYFDDELISRIVTLTSSMLPDGSPAIEFNHDSTRTPDRMLEQGAIDVLVDVLPNSLERKSEIRTRKLFERPLAAIVEDDSPLAARPSIALADLADATFVRLQWGMYTPSWELVVKLCGKRGFAPHYRSVPVASLAEGFSTPLEGGVLIYPTTPEELAHRGASRRRAVPLSDEDAFFTTYAIYQAANEKRLADFLTALEKAGEEATGQARED